MTPSTHPGQPKRISYATHSGFLIFNFAFTFEARLGSVSTWFDPKLISPTLWATII